MRSLLLRRLLLLTLTTLVPGCGWLQTLVLKSIPSRQVLEPLNQGSPQSVAPPFGSLEQEVENIFRSALADAYWHQASALAVLEPEAARGQVGSATLCAMSASLHDKADACVEALLQRLDFPAPPALEGLTAARWEREQDVQRLQQNLREAIHAASSFYRNTRLGPVPPREASAVQEGVRQGLEQFLQYQRNRPLARSHTRPISTFVMSGGAANGAFSAGATWWLLSRLDACKSAGGCQEDFLDIAAGTSTGSLITILLKDYFSTTENRRQRALDMLVASYTCSVNSDLYCVPEASVYDLVSSEGKARGLVRFDGVQQRLERYVDDTTFRSPTEYVASAVEFTSGRIYHFSSADPRYIPDTPALRQAAMSSIVQPAMAEPVEAVGQAKGTLIDGGVRSGLPLLTPLLRGAERALIFVNSPLEGRPLPAQPPNAGAIALRMIDLFALQPVVGEMHEAEHRLAVRRMAEYERCLRRMGLEGSPAAVRQLRELCGGQSRPDMPVRPLVVSRPGTPMLDHIPGSYRSSWIFMPQVLPPVLEEIEPGISWVNLGAAGYQFEPKRMWELFVLGATVAQQRCTEFNDVLGWSLVDSGHGRDHCGDVATLKAALIPVRERLRRSCWDRPSKLRSCSQ